MLQNNLKAKKFIVERTNLINEILQIFSKSLNGNSEELSASIFASGSLLRNNNFVAFEIPAEEAVRMVGARLVARSRFA